MMVTNIKSATRDKTKQGKKEGAIQTNELKRPATKRRQNHEHTTGRMHKRKKKKETKCSKTTKKQFSPTMPLKPFNADTKNSGW